MAVSTTSQRMSEMNLLDHKQAAVDCDFCEGTTDVHWRCKTCSANICRKCKFTHQSRSAFRNHNIIPRMNIGNACKRKQIIPQDIYFRFDAQMSHSSRTSVWIKDRFCIYLIDDNGKTLKVFEFDFRPHGFTITSTETMLVCDVVDKKVWKANEGKTHEVILRTSDVPYGVCCNFKNELVVCMRNSIAIYSSDWKTMIKNIKSHGSGIPFEWPYKIVQNGNLDYILLEWEHHIVKCFDTSFDQKWNYCSSQPSALYFVFDITHDKYDNIFLTYYSGAVEILSPVGQLLKIFYTENAGISRVISVGEDDTLWVWDQKHEINLYSYT